MFDLIDESGKDLERFGYTVKQIGFADISVAFLEVENVEKEKELLLPQGSYYIINSPNLYDYDESVKERTVFLLQDRLKTLLENQKVDVNDKLLIVGLGNPDIDADSLGKYVIDEVYIDALNENNKLYKFCPNIYFSTGIKTFDMVAILVQGLEIQSVIVVDALATSSIERLGRSIQLSSAGMTPGSGVNKLGNRISHSSIGVPCISIGVPFMLYSSSLNLAHEAKKEEILLTQKDVSQNVKYMASIIASALNSLMP